MRSKICLEKCSEITPAKPIKYYYHLEFNHTVFRSY